MDYQFSPVSTPVDKGIPEYRSSPGSSSTPSSQHRGRDDRQFLLIVYIMYSFVFYWYTKWKIDWRWPSRAASVLGEDSTHAKHDEEKEFLRHANQGVWLRKSRTSIWQATQQIRTAQRQVTPRQAPRCGICERMQLSVRWQVIGLVAIWVSLALALTAFLNQLTSSAQAWTQVCAVYNNK